MTNIAFGDPSPPARLKQERARQKARDAETLAQALREKADKLIAEAEKLQAEADGEKTAEPKAKAKPKEPVSGK